MPDEFFTRTQPSLRPRSGTSLRAVLGLSLLAFTGGAILVGYLAWDGRIELGHGVLHSRSAAPVAPPAPTNAAATIGGFDTRVSALEQRLARLDLQVAAAEGNTARAEALLVAFAARRAIERGAPLGYLADQLKLRFADAQPNAVNMVIEAAKNPITLDQLAQQLDVLGPELADAPQSESGWDRFKRELGGLFVIRHGDAPSTQPQDRLQRAKLLLRTGQIDAAAQEVSRMPGAPDAAAWIANAHRYSAVQQALDLIETTALLDPSRLRTASGRPVQQQSPIGSETTP